MRVQKRKLLIAEESEDMARGLAELFRGSCQVRFCAEGNEARKQLTAFRPDVLVLDLMLPGYDGLSLLQWAREQGIDSQVLATTRFCSDYVVETAQKLGVRYLMRKPCSVSALAARVTDMLNQPPSRQEAVRPPADGLRDILMVLGIAGKLRGNTYLRCAIPLFARDPLQSVTKVLYPAVAKSCGCDVCHVERSIRSAIEAAWKNRDEQIWRLYFPTDETGSVKRPTNTAFIACLAQCLETRRETPVPNPENEQNPRVAEDYVRE